MKRVRIDVNELLDYLGSQVIRVEGKLNGQFFDHLADAAHVDSSTLDWIQSSNPNKQQIAEESKACVLLVDEEVAYTKIMQESGKILIVVKNPKVVLAKIGNRFYVKKPISGIHPTAVIDSDAVLGKGISIGAYSVIGKATIGDGCVIDGHVLIYDDVVIGKNCNIKAGAVLGGVGFGFECDEDGNKFRFPQIGGLVIGDNVEIGANTCIDRGALSDTVIGDHTKINNLCHIAHNNQIGKNVTITGCVNVSGSNVIEDNVWIAPNATIRGYVHMGEGCVVGMGSVVTKNIPAHETWIGNPARKLEKK